MKVVFHSLSLNGDSPATGSRTGGKRPGRIVKRRSAAPLTPPTPFTPDADAEEEIDGAEISPPRGLLPVMGASLSPQSLVLSSQPPIKELPPRDLFNSNQGAPARTTAFTWPPPPSSSQQLPTQTAPQNLLPTPPCTPVVRVQHEEHHGGTVGNGNVGLFLPGVDEGGGDADWSMSLLLGEGYLESLAAGGLVLRGVFGAWRSASESFVVVRMSCLAGSDRSLAAKRTLHSVFCTWSRHASRACASLIQAGTNLGKPLLEHLLSSFEPLLEHLLSSSPELCVFNTALYHSSPF